MDGNGKKNEYNSPFEITTNYNTITCKNTKAVKYNITLATK